MLNKTADRGGIMKAKRAICALLAAAFALLSFAACQSGKSSQASESSQSEADTTIETTAPESGLYDIKSYENSDRAAKAATKAAAKAATKAAAATAAAADAAAEDKK